MSLKTDDIEEVLRLAAKVFGDDEGMVSKAETQYRDLQFSQETLGEALRELLDQLHGIGIPEWHGAEGLWLGQAVDALKRAGIEVPEEWEPKEDK